MLLPSTWIPPPTFFNHGKESHKVCKLQWVLQRRLEESPDWSPGTAHRVIKPYDFANDHRCDRPYRMENISVKVPATKLHEEMEASEMHIT
eukprot:6456918-Amphidinium_carterae.1